MVSTSDDDISELQSYESNGHEESEQSDEEIEEIEEEEEVEEVDESELESDVDESDNDLEVMEILGHTEHQPVAIAMNTIASGFDKRVSSGKIIP